MGGYPANLPRESVVGRLICQWQAGTSAAFFLPRQGCMVRHQGSHGSTTAHTAARQHTRRQDSTHGGTTAHTAARQHTRRYDSAHGGTEAHTAVRQHTRRHDSTHDGTTAHTTVRKRTRRYGSTHGGTEARTAARKLRRRRRTSFGRDGLWRGEHESGYFRLSGITSSLSATFRIRRTDISLLVVLISLNLSRLAVDCLRS